MKKFLYGPVFSKRFGKSLGIDLLPHKTCNFNCVYCQLGKSLKLECERKEFYPAEEVISWIKDNLHKYPEYDFITFSGNGEPLLYKKIGKIIDFLKDFQKKPIVILSNGALFYLKEVRNDVKNTDIIVPSLDAGRENTFLKIVRPCKNLNFKKIIEGLINLREEFKGKIFVEIMFVKGLNDSEEEIYAIKNIVENIKPDKIFINTPTRPPAEKWVKSPPREKIEFIAKILSGEIVKPKEVKEKKVYSFEEILNIIERRPILIEEICKRMHKDENAVKELILKDKKVRIINIEGKEYASF